MSSEQNSQNEPVNNGSQVTESPIIYEVPTPFWRNPILLAVLAGLAMMSLGIVINQQSSTVLKDLNKNESKLKLGTKNQLQTVESNNKNNFQEYSENTSTTIEAKKPSQDIAIIRIEDESDDGSMITDAEINQVVSDKSTIESNAASKKIAKTTIHSSTIEKSPNITHQKVNLENENQTTIKVDNIEAKNDENQVLDASVATTPKKTVSRADDGVESNHSQDGQKKVKRQVRTSHTNAKEKSKKVTNETQLKSEALPKSTLNSEDSTIKSTKVRQVPTNKILKNEISNSVKKRSHELTKASANSVMIRQQTTASDARQRQRVESRKGQKIQIESVSAVSPVVQDDSSTKSSTKETQQQSNPSEAPIETNVQNQPSVTMQSEAIPSQQVGRHKPTQRNLVVQPSHKPVEKQQSKSLQKQIKQSTSNGLGEINLSKEQIRKYAQQMTSEKVEDNIKAE